MKTITQTPNRPRIGFALFSLILVVYCIIVGGNVYQLIAEVPNWAADPARALVIHRQFFHLSHAGYFFQTFVPFAILGLLGSTVLLWNRPRAANRWLLLALTGVVAAEVFTLVYFLPRNFILFLDPIGHVPTDTLLTTARQWQMANYLRLALVLVNILTFLKAYRILCAQPYQPEPGAQPLTQPRPVTQPATAYSA